MSNSSAMLSLIIGLNDEPPTRIILSMSASSKEASFNKSLHNSNVYLINGAVISLRLSLVRVNLKSYPSKRLCRNMSALPCLVKSFLATSEAFLSLANTFRYFGLSCLKSSKFKSKAILGLKTSFTIFQSKAFPPKFSSPLLKSFSISPSLSRIKLTLNVAPPKS